MHPGTLNSIQGKLNSEALCVFPVRVPPHGILSFPSHPHLAHHMMRHAITITIAFTFPSTTHPPSSTIPSVQCHLRSLRYARIFLSMTSPYYHNPSSLAVRLGPSNDSSTTTYDAACHHITIAFTFPSTTHPPCSTIPSVR